MRGAKAPLALLFLHNLHFLLIQKASDAGIYRCLPLQLKRVILVLMDMHRLIDSELELNFVSVGLRSYHL